MVERSGYRAIVALFSGVFLMAVLIPPGIDAASGDQLAVVVSVQKQTMYWNETNAINVTVLLNDAPLSGVSVKFSSWALDARRTHDLPLSAQDSWTDVCGNATVNYTYPTRTDRYNNDTIKATVSYQGITATGSVNIKITDPPPTIIPGSDPRNAQQVLTLWGISSGLGVVLFLVILLVVKARKPPTAFPAGQSGSGNAGPAPNHPPDQRIPEPPRQYNY